MTDSKDVVTARIVELARLLIRIPSRAGIDRSEPILDFVAGWCEEHGLPCRSLSAAGSPVGLTAQLSAGRGPSLCLNACLDTAPFGDEANWRNPPTAGVIEGGRLFGRGAADSKIAVAIFLVLASELGRAKSLRNGSLHLLFDADEHTGEFRGVREFVRTTKPLPQAIWIGYPGNQTIVAGSRGLLRARVSVAGLAAHTGGRRKKGVNAIVRAARLIRVLEELTLPSEGDAEFAFGPSLTVTAIHGGEGFSVVPDRCELNLDARLTPGVGSGAVRNLIERSVKEFDRTSSGQGETELVWQESWPAFRVRDDDPAIQCLRSAAERVFRRSIPTSVSGPSNIGNYLSPLGLSPMAGFGVTYDNVHAADEWCETASIWPVYETYRRAVWTFAESAQAGSSQPSQGRPDA